MQDACLITLLLTWRVFSMLKNLKILATIVSWSIFLYISWENLKWQQYSFVNVKKCFSASYELPLKLLGNTLSHKSSTMSHLHIKVTQLQLCAFHKTFPFTLISLFTIHIITVDFVWFFWLNLVVLILIL